ncbi:FtsW/RodA/SpoVE family cell cycle protein [Caldilinea sp.]|uniref:FtsW/RodA/SpoVE family cell cycle protein n=1 Tax=Caldilinea sp. TaxID=2293560 RepID=UPI0021DCC45C|nr:FtsW/RodA/SpoVE family cell cycle protein [Caldilinea sp.]GIV67466.1 MAG: rod shape-determining protein RodA [Caldilinea sp.]
MFARINWRYFDWPLFLVVLLLSSIGVALIYSATRNSPDLVDYWQRQVNFILIGLVVLFFVAMVDYRQLSLLAIPAFLIFVASLVAVYFFGEAQGGSRSWINLGGTLVQPTEAGKFLLIIFLSWYLSWFRDSLHRLPYLLMALLFLLAPLALVYVQPDFGMTITYAFMGGVLILAAGVRYRHLALLGGGALLALPLFAATLQGYMLARLCIFLPTDEEGHILPPILNLLRAAFDTLPTECIQPEANTAASYNVDQALIAIGNGGLTGLGWTQGTQNQLLFLRVRHTDFIFSVIAEELGMIGASLILLLLLFVVWRVLRIAERAPDQFGKLLATGVAALIFFQIVVNVGMNLKIMPVTGLTLPFISYGGSSLISMMFAIGLAESVAMRHRKIEFF